MSDLEFSSLAWLLAASILMLALKEYKFAGVLFLALVLLLVAFFFFAYVQVRPFGRGTLEGGLKESAVLGRVVSGYHPIVNREESRGETLLLGYLLENPDSPGHRYRVVWLVRTEDTFSAMFLDYPHYYSVERFWPKVFEEAVVEYDVAEEQRSGELEDSERGAALLKLNGKSF